MLTDPEGYVSGVLAAAAIILGKVGFDRVRGNGHVTKEEFRALDKKVDCISEAVSSIDGWLRGRMGEPPR